MILPNFVLANVDEEDLLGGKVSKVPRNDFLTDEHPLLRVVPKRYHNLFEVVPLKKHETKAVKVEKHDEVAQTLYVPIRVSFADDPPMSLPMSPKSVEQ